jgi:hypothetical protein
MFNTAITAKKYSAVETFKQHPNYNSLFTSIGLIYSPDTGR